MKRQAILVSLLVVLLLAVFGSSYGAQVYTDWLWFDSLGFSAIFSTVLFTEMAMLFGSWLLFFLFHFVNLKIVHRWFIAQGSSDDPEVIRVDFSSGSASSPSRWSKFIAQIPGLNILIVLVSLFISFGNATNFSGQWLTWQSYLHQVPYGVEDPAFARDISFYLFSLPIYQGIYDTCFPLLLMMLIVVAVLYMANHGFDGTFSQRTPFRHVGILGALAFLVRGAGFGLDILQLVYSPRGAAFGASYADIHALLPVYYISIALAVVCALLMLTLWSKPRKRMLIIAPALFFGFAILGIGFYPGIIQSIQVTPNEFVLERPYLDNNIRYTRLAYDLDNIEEVDFPVGGTANWDELTEYNRSISNIPLLNYRQTQVAFAQLQGMRFYYRFQDIDVDRYRVNGHLTQMMIGPRELAHDALQAGADTWVNRYLKYTHGYGAVMTPVKDFTAEGQPILLVQDIPPQSSVPELSIEQPRIYFGELTSDYAIVRTRSREFDYPQGDLNVENDYQGADGLPLHSFFDRLLFSLRLGTANPILSTEFTSDTRILLYRHILARAQKLAPFLSFDRDPYLVVHEGRLVWILDGYTTSSFFPYAQPWNAAGDNYIRNSVKVTIDAYDGQPIFYIADETDPLIATYNRIFPGFFHSLDDMPEGLRAHLRYPEDMFTIQARMLLAYHMTDAGVFYNQEDMWEFAKISMNGSSTTTEPYYAIMRFPDYDEEEFLIMLPLTPIAKDNMIAYLAGRSDGTHLGELFVYKFPKDRLIYGPAQIQARINQDATISQDLALWRQSGAAIEWGHMITVPLKDSLLYVNPLYIASASSPFPELKRIVLAYGNALVMDETLEGGLIRLFGNPEQLPENRPPAGSGNIDNPPEQGGVAELEYTIAELVRYYDAAESSLAAGDWVAYGRAMAEVERLIRILEQELDSAAHSSSTESESLGTPDITAVTHFSSIHGAQS